MRARRQLSIMSMLDAVGHVVSPKAVVPMALTTAVLARRRRGAARLAIATTTAALTAEVLKRLLPRPRPRAYELPWRSFPSGHSAASTAFFFAAGLLAPARYRPLAMVGAGVATAAVNAMRLGARQHWVTDCLVGDAIGVASVAAAGFALRRTARLRRSVARDVASRARAIVDAAGRATRQASAAGGAGPPQATRTEKHVE